VQPGKLARPLEVLSKTLHRLSNSSWKVSFRFGSDLDTAWFRVSHAASRAGLATMILKKIEDGVAGGAVRTTHAGPILLGRVLIFL